MATALVLAKDGRRENGRWKRGSVAIGESPNSETWRDALKRAGVVLDFKSDLARYDLVARPDVAVGVEQLRCADSLRFIRGDVDR